MSEFYNHHICNKVVVINWNIFLGVFLLCLFSFCFGETRHSLSNFCAISYVILLSYSEKKSATDNFILYINHNALIFLKNFFQFGVSVDSFMKSSYIQLIMLVNFYFFF